MLELMICSLVTILPDYLYRRYAQGKRFGKEITFFSVWYELRWGITGCLMLTVSLITMIFYFHPSTSNATLYFRTVPVMPVGVAGRVAEVNVGFTQAVKQGDVLFKLDGLDVVDVPEMLRLPEPLRVAALTYTPPPSPPLIVPYWLSP